MRVFKYDIDKLSASPIFLGYVGENKATQIAIDVAEYLTQYPGASCTLLVKNPIGDIYPATTKVVDGELIWEVNSSDTAVAGNGQIEVTISGTNEEILKSAKANTILKMSLEGPTGEIPDPYQSWLNELQKKVTAAIDGATQAAENANNAVDGIDKKIFSATEEKVDLDYGKNLINLNGNVKKGIYAFYPSGYCIESAEYQAIAIPVKGEEKVSFNQVFTNAHVVALSAIPDMTAVTAGDTLTGYIEGFANEARQGYVIPQSCKCLVVSIPINSAPAAQCEYGEVSTAYSPYVEGINASKIIGGVLFVGDGYPYATIKDACDAAHDGDTIYIMPGTYKESVICYDKEVRIKGYSRDSVILTNDSGNYFTPPLYIAKGAVEDLTIAETASEKDESAIAPAYCVHVDSDPQEGHSLTFKNVCFTNGLAACVGIGLRSNFKLSFQNCEFVSDEGYAVYLHESQYNGSKTQYAEFVDCVMQSNQAAHAICMQETPTVTESEACVRFQRCIVKSASDEVITMVQYGTQPGLTGSGYLGSSVWKLDALSADNSASEMNALVFADVSKKADKVSGATAGNFAALDQDGNLKDSGKNAEDFAALSTNVDSLKDDILQLADGVIRTPIGKAAEMTYASYRYTTSHMKYSDDVAVKSSQKGEGIEYSWRVFNATGEYISSEWNTEYVIPAETEFYLLIRKTVNGGQVSWSADEAYDSVVVESKTGVIKSVDALDAQVGAVENRIDAVEENVGALTENVDKVVPQTDVKTYNTAGNIETTDASATKIFYVYYNFIAGNEYTVKITAKNRMNLVGNKTLVIATTPSENIGHAIDWFSNTNDSPMGIISNFKDGDSYEGSLIASDDANILTIIYSTTTSSVIDADVTISKTASMKEISETVFDYSIAGLNRDIEPTVLQLSAEIPSSSDYGNSPYRRVTFAHFSDIHAAVDRWERICEYIDTYDFIKFGVHTGDYVGSSMADGKDLYGTKKPINKAILNVVGNHDTYTRANPYITADKAVTYANLYKSVDVVADGWDCTFGIASNAMYWFKDDDDSKVRFIAIDQYYWDDAQAEWFTSALTSARQNDFAVVLFMHTPMTKKITSIGTSFWTLGGWDTGVSETEDSPTIVAIRSAIASFRSAGGTFICYLCGHVHSDQIGKLDTDGLLQIRIENASGIGVWCESNRQKNTKNYDCLNIVQIDRAYGLIKVVRVGVNTDPHMQAKNAVCYDYINGKLISNW